MNFLAIRYLLSRKRQSILTLLGIILGTAGYVSISGIMLGFQDYLLDQFINNDCHIRIKARDEPVTEKEVRSLLYPGGQTIHWLAPPTGRRSEENILNVPGWTDRLSRDNRVQSFALQLQLPTLVHFQKANVAVRLIGINPEDQLRVSTLEKYMTLGSYLDLSRGTNQLIVGEPLLEKLGARVGDLVLLSSGANDSVPFKIKGTSRFGMKNVDEGIIYTRLADAQSLAHAPSRISDIIIRLTDVDLSRKVAQELSSNGLELVQSWEQANEGTLSVFKTQDIVRYSMTISILVVAGFGIFNVLSMTVSQKRKEIAILRSIGFEPHDIVELFLFQGTVLGVIGGVVGVALGYFITVMLSHVEVATGRAFGSGHMMISFAPRIYVLGFAIAFFSSALSSYLPARGAGKLHPMEIMRSEA
jgi:lipoprotein-releasing system permease protein